MSSGPVLLYFLGELILIGNIAKAYDNIALGKSAYQQFSFPNKPWGADKAVDGRYSDRSANGGQCTISGNQKQTATWWVDLGNVLNIHHTTIYFRTDNAVWDSTNGYTARILGFSVYISNTTNRHEGTLCFKDTNYTRATIPDVATIECVKHGRYVIFYNERLPGVTYPDGYSAYAYNELCELQVYGCPAAGVYGENCSLPCPKNCQEGHCDIVDGTCLGCVAGYEDLRCEEQCDNNRYGLECNLTCGNCSNGDQCHHVNGSCQNGCDVGAQGDKCDEACPFGRHGKNCVEFCKPNCKGCNRFSGVCESGCYRGWKGAFCEKECDGWMYGEDCMKSCGSCLNFEQCHHMNGSCLKGCDRGFQGETCTEGCMEGRYGYNCQESCSFNCGVSGRCNRITGQCQGGCQEGWEDTKCDKKCEGGKFGLNCAQSCGRCFGKEPCHYVNGSCLNGCDKGYQGINCKDACQDGRYGYNCQETCSNCRVAKTCDAISGQCGVLEISSDSETNSRCCPFLYGVVSILGLSVGLNIIFIIWRCRYKVCKGQKQQGQSTKRLSFEHTTSHTEIYDKAEEDTGYQELGQISQPSHYDQLH